jgi:hypothetical protein
VFKGLKYADQHLHHNWWLNSSQTFKTTALNFEQYILSRVWSVRSTDTASWKRPSTICNNQNANEHYSSRFKILNLHKMFHVPHTHKNLQDIEVRRHRWSVRSTTTNPPHILKLAICNAALISVVQIFSAFMFMCPTHIKIYRILKSGGIDGQCGPPRLIHLISFHLFSEKQHSSV